jgi:thiamine-monophosphate kinase
LPLAEKALIAKVRRQAAVSQGQRTVIAGIGDDCGVVRVPPRHEVLVTTDFSLEGIHFRPDWHSPEVIGHRCLTRGLSDIAAMGGEAVAIFLSLALPRGVPQRWVDGFVRGLLRLAGQFEVPLAGGDTAESPTGIAADIVVLGSVTKGKAILRSGAHVGDPIYVTGQLGGSAAAIERLLRSSGSKLRVSDYPQHFHPLPRIAVGRYLRQRGIASAMIDISDGLSTDLAHLCEESEVGAEIQAEAIPRAIAGRQRRAVDLRFALHGGDDYELLFTAPPGKRVPGEIAGVTITQIGKIMRKGRIMLARSGVLRELTPQGWEHFESEATCDFADAPRSSGHRLCSR